MRKVLSVLLVCAMLFAMMAIGSTVSAAGTSAFDKETFRIKKGNLCILYDNIDNTGGSSGNAFCYADNYGTGRNDKGDFVVYNDVDFGSKGASKVTVNFGFHNPEKYPETKFAVYIDNPYGAPIATYTVKKGETKGSEIANHKEFAADCAVAAGKHDVYFMATNEASGSFDYLYFTEAASAVAATKTVANNISYDKLAPFTKLEVIKGKTIMVDQIDTMAKGGSGKEIAYVDGYGCGYSSLDDMVVFPNCDFGAKGAKSFAIFFSYGGTDGSKTKIDVYIDNPYGTPACSFDIGTTGGYKIENAKLFSADCKVAPGAHTVFVRFANEKSGSFSYCSFVEGDAVPVTTAKAAATTAKAASSTTKAAQTADFVVVPVIAAIVSLTSAAVVSKRKNQK